LTFSSGRKSPGVEGRSALLSGAVGAQPPLWGVQRGEAPRKTLIDNVSYIIDDANILAVAAVNPRHPLADDAHHLIVHRVGHRGNLLHRDAFAVFLPHNGDLLAV